MSERERRADIRLDEAMLLIAHLELRADAHQECLAQLEARLAALESSSGAHRGPHGRGGGPAGLRAWVDAIDDVLLEHMANRRAHGLGRQHAGEEG